MIIYELTRHWNEAWEAGWDSLGLFLHKRYILAKFEYLQNRSERINQYKAELDRLSDLELESLPEDCSSEVYSQTKDKGWDRIHRYTRRCEKLMRKTDPGYRHYDRVSYYLLGREVQNQEA